VTFGDDVLPTVPAGHHAAETEDTEPPHVESTGTTAPPSPTDGDNKP
jgi:hypothetical protein